MSQPQPQQTQDFNRSPKETTDKNLSKDEPAQGRVGNNVEKDEPLAQRSSMK
jgi:hypothetical protein